jgi:hypothetical protein
LKFNLRRYTVAAAMKALPPDEFERVLHPVFEEDEIKVRTLYTKTMNPILYTLYPIPYTLYPIPCTLYPIPYTLYPIPYTLYPIPYTLYPVPASCTGTLT